MNSTEPLNASTEVTAFRTASPRAHRGKLAVLGIVATALAASGTGALVALNPSPSVSQSGSAPLEMLDDGSFVHRVDGSAWRVDPSVSDASFRVERTDEGSFGVLTGRIEQDVPLPAFEGTALRFRADVRAHDGEVAKGVIGAQTRCAQDDEVAVTSFTASSEWTRVFVTLTPSRGGCSLQVGVAGRAIDVDNASLSFTPLINPSFVTSIDGWQITNGTNGSSLRHLAGEETSRDGSGAMQFTVGSSATSVVQDVVLDRSSEATFATAEIWARAPSASARVRLRVSNTCDQGDGETEATIGTTWVLLRVAQERRKPTTPGAPPPETPNQIRPSGEPCRQRMEIAVDTPGAVVQLDGAHLDLRSYYPPTGSPQYLASIKAVVDRNTEIAEDAADEAAIHHGRSPRRRDPLPPAATTAK